jgi:hypothetical protein
MFTQRLVRPILLLVLLGVTAAFTLQPAKGNADPAPDPGKEIVYITETGKKYHRDNCRYLKSSKRPVSLAAATECGFGLCLVCRPSVLQQPVPAPTEKELAKDK